MSRSTLDDARAAYSAWKETQQGSYLERVIADGIVRDLVPALIHMAERQPLSTGFTHIEIEAAEEVADQNQYPSSVSHIGA